MDGYCGEWDGENLEKGIANMSKMIDVVEKILSEKKGYTVKQCCQELGITPKDFHSRYLKRSLLSLMC